MLHLGAQRALEAEDVVGALRRSAPASGATRQAMCLGGAKRMGCLVFFGGIQDHKNRGCIPKVATQWVQWVGWVGRVACSLATGLSQLRIEGPSASLSPQGGLG